MKNTKKLLMGAMLLASSINVQAAYDVVDRYKLLEDKFKTEEMLTSFGHDFLIDIKASLNKNFTDFKDDIEKASDATGTTTQKINTAQDILNTWDKTEQTARVKVSFGVPLFSFTAFGVKIVPDLRLGADFGANLGIRTETITASNLIDLIAADADPTVISTIKALTDTEFATLLGSTYNGNVGEYLKGEKGIPAVIADKFKDIIITDVNSPDISAYTKLDIRGGLLLNWFKENYFGYVNLYGMHRTDFFLRLNASQIAADKSFTDGADEANSQVFFMTDLKFGSKFLEKYSAFVLLEDIKIARMSDSLEKGGELNYAPKPLIRLHADAMYKFGGLSLNPFVGLHKRNGYGLSSGIYAGADLGAHVWGDRLGLRFRAMADKEHLTLNPQLKLWFMQLDYSLKSPLSSTVDDVKVSSIHSLNFRLFF